MKTHMTALRRILIIPAACLVAACSESKMPLKTVSMSSLDSVAPAAWQALSKRRVFFGHQSVGQNIATGLTDVLARRTDIPLQMVREKDLGAVSDGALIFKHVGENGDAAGKVGAFASIVESAAPRAGDIVMQKLCYADFGGDTDAEATFAEYVRAIEELRVARPDLQIVHVTAPLLEDRLFPKDIARQILGKTTLKSRLVKVRQYNSLLRSHYAGKDPIFDLAAIEAGHNGTSGEARDSAEALLSVYATRDGGHLNGAGQEVAAIEFLRFLADIPAPVE